MARVSVVIASYNHGKYVGEAIESVLSQDYQDFEIVITDDGSTDDSVERIKEFTDPRIRLFCFPANRGACTAMRNCLEHATGHYVALLNSDDAFLPGKLTRQVQFLDAHPDVGAVFGHATVVDAQGNSLAGRTSRAYLTVFDQPNRSRFEWLRYFFLHGNCLCHPTLLIRRECYDTVGFLDERYAQLPDLDFWIRLCMRYDIHIMQEPLIRFRLHSDEGNASGKTPPKVRRATWEYRHLLDHYLKIDSSRTLQKIFPEAHQYGDSIDPQLIPYALARIALEAQPLSQVRQMFAVETLFALLQDDATARTLAATFGFTYRDFIELTGRYDLFGISEINELRDKIKHPLRSWSRRLAGSFKK
jgi:glycosyltransferase involved in cell wall biosynthesis